MRRHAVAAAILLAQAGAAAAAPYGYHTYQTLSAELEELEAAYPALAEHSTAQALYGLPPVADGAAQLEQHLLRITNEGSGLDKPEVLLVGAQHGDETVGTEACLALARLLLEGYGRDPWLTALVDRREIYLVPVANPWGFNHASRYGPGAEGAEAAEDMNRDHPYDRCSFGCTDEQALSTVGGRALYELARRHLFRVVIDYHGGVEMILHQWGTPLHGEPLDESPDSVSMGLLGQRLSSFAGPYNGAYPVGTANDLLGPVYGPLDDSSYATGWDGQHADAAFRSTALRALSYTVEVSDQKQPPEATLGGDSDVLTPGGIEDGYVPKSVRIGLAAIDAAEPWVTWIDPAGLPVKVEAGEPIDLKWQVRGCFQVDETRVRYGPDPDPASSFAGQSLFQSDLDGAPCFGVPRTFSARVRLSAPGRHYLAPVARVDGALLAQASPNPPGVPPQSWLVRSRTEAGLLFSNDADPGEVNTVAGRLYWSAEPLAIDVVPRTTAAPALAPALALALLAALRLRRALESRSAARPRARRARARCAAAGLGD